MEETLRWKRLHLLPGRIKVGSYFWTSLRPANDPNKYAISIVLPGIRIRADCQAYPTEEKARDAVERICREWMRLAELTVRNA